MERLFALEDLTERVRARQEDVRRALAQMRAALGCDEVPAIAVGRIARNPTPALSTSTAYVGLTPSWEAAEA